MVPNPTLLTTLATTASRHIFFGNPTKCPYFYYPRLAIPTLFIALLDLDAVVQTLSLPVEDLRALCPGAAWLDALFDAMPAFPVVDLDFLAHC